MNLAGRQVVDTIDIVTARAAPAKLEEHGESMRLGGACDGLTWNIQEQKARSHSRDITSYLHVRCICIASQVSMLS